MNNFAKSIMGLAFSLALVVVIFGLAIWGVTSYIDDNFGDGTAGLVFMLVTGVGGTVLIYTVSNFQTNQTHQSAGDDITEFAKNMGRAQVEQVRLVRDLERRERERHGLWRL